MNFVALVHECAPWASAQTMASIVGKESAFNPLAIGINGGSKLARQPVNKEEAVVTANWLLAHGYNIDIGLGQINYKNLGKLGLSVNDAFDACKNIRAAALLLSWNYEAAKSKIAGEQPALLAAISTYNTGNMRSGFQNGYVRDVVANAGLVLPVVPLASSVSSRTRAKAAAPKKSTENVPGQKTTRYANDDGTTAQTATYNLTFE